VAGGLGRVSLMDTNYWQILMDTDFENQKLNQQMLGPQLLKIFETAGPLF
jgi:hypothetical protein